MKRDSVCKKKFVILVTKFIFKKMVTGHFTWLNIAQWVFLAPSGVITPTEKYKHHWAILNQMKSHVIKKNHFPITLFIINFPQTKVSLPNPWNVYKKHKTLIFPRKKSIYFVYKTIKQYSQLTWTSKRFETEGGIPLEAIHKYPPISVRCTCCRVNLSPSTCLTTTYKIEVITPGDNFQYFFLVITLFISSFRPKNNIFSTFSTPLHTGFCEIQQ